RVATMRSHVAIGGRGHELRTQGDCAPDHRRCRRRSQDGRGALWQITPDPAREGRDDIGAIAGEPSQEPLSPRVTLSQQKAAREHYVAGTEYPTQVGNLRIPWHVETEHFADRPGEQPDRDAEGH